MSESVYDKDALNGVLYYIATPSDCDKIMKEGFILRSGRERVCFLVQEPSDDFHTVFSDLCASDSESAHTTSDKFPDFLSVLKINLNANIWSPFKNIAKYRFFKDLKTSAIFTYENIDPLCISHYKDIKLPGIREFDSYLKTFE